MYLGEEKKKKKKNIFKKIKLLEKLNFVKKRLVLKIQKNKVNNKNKYLPTSNVLLYVLLV